MKLRRRISNWLAQRLIGLIRFYQRAVSPMFRPTCRFVPTCSEYFILAVQRYGLVRGTVKGIGRLLRCHPWGGSGVDPP